MNHEKASSVNLHSHFIFFYLLQHRQISLLSEITEFPAQLTSTQMDYMPYLSPGGDYIAFLTYRNTHDPLSAAVRFELWVMTKNGYFQHLIISINDLYGGEMSIRDVCWLKDSENLLVNVYRCHKGREIWKVNLKGDKIKMTSPNDWAEQPLVSPDGLKIAYKIRVQNQPEEFAEQLYVTDTDFSNSVLLETGHIQHFAWGNYSHYIIYSLYDRPNENYDLWECSINGTQKKRFTETNQNEKDAIYSSDGNYLAFTVEKDLFLTRTDNFQPEKIADNAYHPKWIPDRHQILVDCVQSSEQTRWTESRILDIEGNMIKKIAEGKST